MKDVTLTPQPAAQVQPFSSLEALRIAHDELLDRIDQTGETPELWEQSTALVWRVQRRKWLNLGSRLRGKGHILHLTLAPQWPR